MFKYDATSQCRTSESKARICRPQRGVTFSFCSSSFHEAGDRNDKSIMQNYVFIALDIRMTLFYIKKFLFYLGCCKLKNLFDLST